MKQGSEVANSGLQQDCIIAIDERTAAAQCRDQSAQIALLKIWLAEKMEITVPEVCNAVGMLHPAHQSAVRTATDECCHVCGTLGYISLMLTNSPSSILPAA